MGHQTKCTMCKNGVLFAVGVELEQEKLACTGCGMIFVIDLKDEKSYDDL